MKQKLRRLLSLTAAAALLLVGGCTLLGGEPSEPADATTTSTTFRTTLSQATYSDFLLSLGTVNGAEGETVELPLTVSAQAYLVNADLILRYDPTLLQPVTEEDGSCAVPVDWTGGLWSAETEAGCVKLMLATAEDGVAEAMTLCTVRFRLLTAQPATVTLGATAVGACQPQDAGVDATAKELVQFSDGTIKETENAATEEDL